MVILVLNDDKFGQVFLTSGHFGMSQMPVSQKKIIFDDSHFAQR